MMMFLSGIDSSAERRALKRRRRSLLTQPVVPAESDAIPVPPLPVVIAQPELPQEPAPPPLPATPVAVPSPPPPAYDPAPFTIGDPGTRLSLAAAKRQGYAFHLDTDGSGKVTNPDGRTYTVQAFLCDCPDRRRLGGSHGGCCKHEHWFRQMRPCDTCGGIMFLGEFRTAFGEVLRRFECPGCGNARDHALVEEERSVPSWSPDSPLSAEDRCRQAVSWYRLWHSDHCLWTLLEHSPHLAPLLTKMLADDGHQALADAVARKHGLLPEAA